MFNQSQLRWLAVWLLRVALAFSFLSAVADRFGLWGQFGVGGVAWGDFERFTAYTARLLWFLPPSLVSPAAILATAAEVIVAGGLLVGWRLHWWAFAAAALLLSFALAMTGALGVKAPTDASVWTAAAAAFLLGVVALREHGAEGTRNFDADARKQERDARARVTQKVDH
jgi:amino acid transporter